MYRAHRMWSCRQNQPGRGTALVARSRILGRTVIRASSTYPQVPRSHRQEWPQADRTD